MRAERPSDTPHPGPAAVRAWPEALRDGEAVMEAIAPGETVRFLATAQAASGMVRDMLRHHDLRLLRTERQDDGDLLITVVRPDQLW